MNKNNKITTLDEMPLILTVRDIEKIMGISKVKAYELVRTEGFPVIKVGRRITIPKPAFERWLNSCGGE